MTGVMNVRRCGTCHFGKLIPQDISKRVCWGAPPSAVQLPMAGGKLTLQMARPIVGVTDDACALWRGKDADDVARENDQIKMVQSNPQMFETKQ